MAMQEISVLVPPLPRVPRGALLVGAVVDGWIGAKAWLGARLAARRESVRARRAVARAARRDARDRAELLALARCYEASQPEFAKDLLAAANVDRTG